MRIDDPRVRVVVATEQPHKPSDMHEHGMNRVMIYLGDGEMQYTTASGKVTRIKFKKGDVKWNPAEGPHISENVSDHAFQRRASGGVKFFGHASGKVGEAPGNRGRTCICYGCLWAFPRQP